MAKGIRIDSVITKFNGIPQEWLRPGDTEITYNYRSLPPSEHTLDGWKDIIIPAKSVYQKYGVLMDSQDGFSFTYEVIDFTIQEIENYDDIVRANQLDVKEIDGDTTFKDVRNLIQKKLDKGLITQNQRDNIYNGLKPVRRELQIGDWQEAQRYFTPGENVYIDPAGFSTDLLEIYNLIKSAIETYNT